MRGFSSHKKSVLLCLTVHGKTDQLSFVRGKTETKTDRNQMIKKITVKGYEVELDTDGEDGGTQCYVSKGNYSASLEALLGTGCLSDRNWEDVEVNPDTIEKIYDWALANGY